MNISDSPSYKGIKFTKGKFVGEIKVSTDERKLNAIPEYAANVLPVGTKIYKTDYIQIYFAEVNGKLIPYGSRIPG